MLNKIDGIEQEKGRYWDDFYSVARSQNLQAPSQFATFMAQESDGASLIIEVGCGSGRDAIFLARQGFNVVAIDGSESAIQACDSLCDSLGLKNAKFRHASVGEPEFEKVLSEIMAEKIGCVGLYARFFLHAITDEEERAFLDAVAKHLRQGDFLALEFRTTKDSALEKVTTTHYRRYIYPPNLFSAVNVRGFSVEYTVEGFGFAKYKQDDAYVARCIFRKN